MAARLDDNYEIVAGVLSSKPEKAIIAGLELGLPEDRVYTDVIEMLEREGALESGAEVIAIMTPNDSHVSYAINALKRGFHVICDKPMTNSVEDAKELHKCVKTTGKLFCLTHNYSGYPMVRQMRAMIESGDLGELRLVQVEYVQGGKADESKIDDPNAPRGWKFNKEKSGPSLVLGDIGSHAHHLIRYTTGLEITEVCAEVGAIVPNRVVDDYAGALLHMEKGVRGNFWVTQAAAGKENGLKIRISGSKGTVEWLQEIPQVLEFTPLNAPKMVFSPNGPGTYPLSQRACRIVKGHPEGFPEAFANLYSDFASTVRSFITGKEVDPLANTYPDSYDGLIGIKFIDAMIRSSNSGSSWVELGV